MWSKVWVEIKWTNGKCNRNGIFWRTFSEDWWRKNQLNSSLDLVWTKLAILLKFRLYTDQYKQKQKMYYYRKNNSRHIRFMKSSDLSNIMIKCWKKTDSGLVSIIVLISFHDNLSIILNDFPKIYTVSWYVTFREIRWASADKNSYFWTHSRSISNPQESSTTTRSVYWFVSFCI